MSHNAELVIGVALCKCGVVRMQLLKISNSEEDFSIVPILENYSDVLFFKHLTLKLGKSS